MHDNPGTILKPYELIWLALLCFWEVEDRCCWISPNPHPTETLRSTVMPPNVSLLVFCRFPLQMGVWLLCRITTSFRFPSFFCLYVETVHWCWPHRDDWVFNPCFSSQQEQLRGKQIIHNMFFPYVSKSAQNNTNEFSFRNKSLIFSLGSLVFELALYNYLK